MFVVFHHTDTHIYLLFLALASSIHNKQQQTMSLSLINLVSIFRCSSSAHNRVHVRRVDSSTLVFSLSSHRNSYIGFVFNSRKNHGLGTCKIQTDNVQLPHKMLSKFYSDWMGHTGIPGIVVSNRV